MIGSAFQNSEKVLGAQRNLWRDGLKVECSNLQCNALLDRLARSRKGRLGRPAGQTWAACKPGMKFEVCLRLKGFRTRPSSWTTEPPLAILAP